MVFRERLDGAELGRRAGERRQLRAAAEPFLGFEIGKTGRHRGERIHLQPQPRYRDGSFHRRHEPETTGATMARSAAMMLGATMREVRGLSEGRLRLVMVS